jgi:hypothetical protein
VEPVELSRRHGRIVVWLAQMLAAMPSIFGDHSRIKNDRIWRWCKMAPPLRLVWSNHSALRACRSRLSCGGMAVPMHQVDSCATPDISGIESTR